MERKSFSVSSLNLQIQIQAPKFSWDNLFLNFVQINFIGLNVRTLYFGSGRCNRCCQIQNSCYVKMVTFTIWFCPLLQYDLKRVIFGFCSFSILVFKDLMFLSRVAIFRLLYLEDEVAFFFSLVFRRAFAVSKSDSCFVSHSNFFLKTNFLKPSYWSISLSGLTSYGFPKDGYP